MLLSKIFIAIIVMLSVVPSVVAAKIPIVITGNTHAFIKEVSPLESSDLKWGGIARRAAVIDNLRREHGSLVLIDSGNFTAGGKLDLRKVTETVDKERSQLSYEIMDMLGYDCVNISAAEFNFGTKFLLHQLNTTPLTFLSANSELGHTVDYKIKTVKGANVAVVGLSSEKVLQSHGLMAKNYSVVLDDIIMELKGRADIVVLISDLKPEATVDIAQKYSKYLDVLIYNNPEIKEINKDAIDGSGEIILVKPSYGGGEVRMLNLEFDKGKIADYKLERYRLKGQMKADTQIEQVIPECFSGGDCVPEPGFKAGCIQMRSGRRECVYRKLTKIKAKIITALDCPFCVTFATQRYLKKVFPSLEFEVIDYREKKAQKLIKNLSIKKLPAFIMPTRIKNNDNFNEIRASLIKRNNFYLAKEDISGIFLFLNRKLKPNTIDMFFRPQDKNVGKITKMLYSQCQKKSLNCQLHLILPSTAGFKDYSASQAREAKILLATKHLYPEKIWDFVVDKYAQGLLIEAFDRNNLSYKKVAEFVDSAAMADLINENNNLAKEFNIGKKGIVIVINNRWIFQIIDANTEQFNKMIAITKGDL
jgi:hypothetical protein